MLVVIPDNPIKTTRRDEAERKFPQSILLKIIAPSSLPQTKNIGTKSEVK